MGTNQNLITLKMPKVTLQGKRVYYPADDAVVNFKRACKTPNPPKGRKSIVPGSVVILLSGRFRGKRVVCLKTLPSGLLLVTGPYKLNGVPLKRVNPAYVIPTSSKLNVSDVNVEAITDEFFAKSKSSSAKKGEDALFGDNVEMSAEEKAKLDRKRAAQKEVDSKLIETVKKTDAHFASYLKTRFTLRNNMRFHEI